jgi:hypothetical protein
MDDVLRMAQDSLEAHTFLTKRHWNRLVHIFDQGRIWIFVSGGQLQDLNANLEMEKASNES